MCVGVGARGTKNNNPRTALRCCCADSLESEYSTVVDDTAGAVAGGDGDSSATATAVAQGDYIVAVSGESTLGLDSSAVRFARIKTACKYQSCMVDQARMRCVT